MKTALIISGGEFNTYVPNMEYDLIIACDKGLEYAHELKITPDIILGDFDSMDQTKARDLNGQLSSNGNFVEVVTFPVEKDDTDTMLAIKHAISLGYQHMVIICALGGRTDHLMANIQSLNFAANHNVLCEIYSSNERLVAYQGPCEIAITRRKDYSLSLYALSEEVNGLTLRGTKYDVSDIMLTNSFPLAYGNSILDSYALIKFDHGTLLIIESLIIK